MNDLYKQWWPEARFLVDRGVSVSHTSPEGATAESLLNHFLERAKGYNQPEDPVLLRLLSDIHLRASGDVQRTRNAVE